jgi:hypothetical protein
LLNRSIFGRETAHQLCDKIVLKQNFVSLFERIITHPTSWIYSVARPTNFQCKCQPGRECETSEITLKGTGILQHPEGCELITEQYSLRVTGYFESECKMDSTSIIVPNLPTLLSTKELQYFQTRRDSVDMVLNELELDSIQTDTETGITTQRLTVGVKGHSESLKWRSWFIPSTVFVLILAIVVVLLVKWRARVSCLFGKRTRTRPAIPHTERP